MTKIVQTPGVLGGKPRVDGTRISVELILEDLRSGLTPAEIVEAYESLTVADVETAVTYAMNAVRAASVAAE